MKFAADPGTILLDATADLSGVSKLTLGHAPVPTPQARFDNLVARFDHSEGYKLFSLIRASFVVRCHSAMA